MSFKHMEPIFKSEVVKYENGQKNFVKNVDSKYLTDANGNYVIDPTSPTGEPYIVPANMDFDKTVQKFTELFMNTPITSALLLANFQTGGTFDLQRTDINGESYGGFVSDYTSSASLYFGAASAALTVPANIAEIGGGLLNLTNSLSNNNINTSGDYWNNPNNVQNIREGLSYYQNNISTDPSVDFLLNALDMLLDLAHASNLASHLDDFINGSSGSGGISIPLWLADALGSGVDNASRARSPLILDLNGNGIVETISKDNIFFDHDNNDFAELSGWASKNDGLLVLDRNGNGTIDNGTELFGNNTLLDDGSKAPNGFEALSEFDSNNDGIINQNDERYNELKIWQDLNEDGTSTSDELFALDTFRIESLNLNYSESYKIDEQNNEHRQLGSFTKTDGQTYRMDDVWFDVNLVSTKELDLVDVSEDILNLPNISGIGNISSLHQAMAKDETGELQALVTNYIETKDVSLINDLIYHWAGVQDIDPESRSATKIYGNVIGDARKLEFLEEAVGEEYVGIWCWGEYDPNPHGQAAPILLETYEKFKEFVVMSLNVQTNNNLISKIDITLNNNMTIQNVNVDRLIQFVNLSYIIDPESTINELNTLKSFLNLYRTDMYIVVEAISEYGNTYGNELEVLLKSFEYSSINGDTENNTLYGNENSNILIGGLGDDQLYGDNGNDMYIFNLGDGQDTIYDNSWNFNNKDTIRFGEGISSNNLEVTRSDYDLVLAIQGTTDKITINSYFMSTSSKVEEFVFADGTTLTSQQIESMVAIRGTNGNDYLYGYETNDTYIFNLGDGQDMIYDSSWNMGNKDTIRFGEGIRNDNLEVTRSDYDLVLTIQGTTDKITINSYFMSTSSKVEEFVFHDGTTLTSQQIESMVVLRGTDNNDSISGFMDADTIIGGRGNDTFYGDDGNDTYIFNLGDGQDTIYDSSWNMGNKDTIKFGDGIRSDNLDVTRSNDNLVLTIQGTTDKITVMDYFMNTSSKVEEFVFHDGTTLTSQQIESMVVLRGTDNNDSISGFMDADTIIGGKGNDTLDGQDGNDTYIFNLGDAQDTIYDYSTNTGNKDIIHFSEEIGIVDLEIVRDGNNLIFSVIGTNDKITVNEWYTSSQNKIEQFKFADGTIFTSTQVQKMLTFLGTPNNDTLTGTSNSDILKSFAGDDTLNGGAGADKFYGGMGNDIYIVDNLNDMIIENIDEGVDSIKSKISFTLPDNVENLILTGATSINAIGNSLNNTITGNSVINQLNGRYGDDLLDAKAGDDILIGGVGNDTLWGGAGNDTYIFNLGDGQDTIYDASGTTNAGIDTLIFGEGIVTTDIAIFKNGADLVISYGNNDIVTITSQTNPANTIEKVYLNDGKYMSSADIDTVIGSINEYASSHNITIESIGTIKNDQNLMAIIAESWHF